jgi:hypothetical protein
MTHPDNGRNVGLLFDAVVPDLPAPRTGSRRSGAVS